LISQTLKQTNFQEDIYVQISIKKEPIIPYLFLGPALIGLLVFRIFPIANAFVSSFCTAGFNGITKWAGFSNYSFLFHDATFWKSLWVTIKWSLIINPFQILSALVLAIFVNRQLKGIGFFRTMYFIPITVSLSVASTIWGLMLNPNSGLVNAILTQFMIPAQPFLSSPKQALWVLMIIASWRGIGYWMMFLLAGLQGIPVELYEAAKIDGAKKSQILRKVTLPLLKRTLAFVTVADTCSNFLLFVPMFVLTKGGPNLSTNVLIYEAYNNAFIYGDRGISSAIVMVILIVIVMVVGLELRMLRTDH
jgi:multiple sugar transport system permease protein